MICIYFCIYLCILCIYSACFACRSLCNGEFCAYFVHFHERVLMTKTIMMTIFFENSNVKLHENIKNQSSKEMLMSQTSNQTNIKNSLRNYSSPNETTHCKTKDNPNSTTTTKKRFQEAFTTIIPIRDSANQWNVFKNHMCSFWKSNALLNIWQVKLPKSVSPSWSRISVFYFRNCLSLEP